MLKVVTPKTKKAQRELEKRAPKLVENAKKTLILQGMKTSNVLNSVLADIFHLKRAGGGAIRFTKKNDNIRPFESGGETSLEFFSLKTDCSLFVFGSHSKKRPNNLVLGRTFDNHVYDLIEVGVEHYKPMNSFNYEKKFAPRVGSKPFFAFIGEAFETVEELKHLKEVLLDLFRERAFLCTAVSSNTVVFMQCGIRLKKSGTFIPKIELVEVGPSMNFVVRRHRLANEGLRKAAMKSTSDKPRKKQKNVSGDIIEGRIGKIYVPDQKVGTMAPSHKIKGMKRERKQKYAESEGRPKNRK